MSLKKITTQLRVVIAKPHIKLFQHHRYFARLSNNVLNFNPFGYADVSIFYLIVERLSNDRKRNPKKQKNKKNSVGYYYCPTEKENNILL